MSTLSRIKIKTSITISKKILASIDALLKEKENRSEFIEKILKDYLRSTNLKSHSTKDLAIINRNADRLNKEAEDVLNYQVEL
jgi:metal-responsive CopG/Arc/MetJ family transcriptional regulator